MNLDYIIRPQKYVRQELFGNKNTDFFVETHYKKYKSK